VSEPQFEVEIIGPDGVPVGVVRRQPPPPRRVWLHVLLFLLTFVTTTLVVGLSHVEIPELTSLAALRRALAMPKMWTSGIAFSIPLLSILLAHEMGHYIACRRHRLDASLPYFLPIPLGIGTLGAFIKIRTPLANKRELFDVGAAGPLAGIVVALPLLVLGIALSQPVSELPQSGMWVFGEPLLFKAVGRLLHPELRAGSDLLLHPTGFAAWFGLFATALNLLPFGQLDGGHVTYAMFGRRQRFWAWPLLLVLIALGFVWTGWWLWAVIALAMGVRHPRLPDEDAPLDPRRRRLAWLCIVIFLLCFTPEPITIVP
jgi:membrane-associated protease RseP (regulator of RpoE activity)